MLLQLVVVQGVSKRASSLEYHAKADEVFQRVERGGCGSEKSEEQADGRRRKTTGSFEK